MQVIEECPIGKKLLVRGKVTVKLILWPGRCVNARVRFIESLKDFFCRWRWIRSPVLRIGLKLPNHPIDSVTTVVVIVRNTPD